jgi:hypothetical protein
MRYLDYWSYLAGFSLPNIVEYNFITSADQWISWILQKINLFWIPDILKRIKTMEKV